MSRFLGLTLLFLASCQNFDAGIDGAVSVDAAVPPASDLAMSHPDLSTIQVSKDMAVHKDASVLNYDMMMSTDLSGGDLATLPGGPGNDHCATATQLVLTQMRMDLPVNTTNALHDLTSCSGTSGADVFFTFTLNERELVYADTFGATWDTSLFFASSCSTPLTVSTTTGDSICNDDACGTSQSQIMAVLNAGKYYLVVSGKGSGTATVHLEHAPVGRGPLAQLAQGVSTQTGTTTGLGAMFHCMGAGAENSYWWATCPSGTGGTFTASACGGVTWDSVLYIQIPRSNSEVCNDDACGVQSVIGATIPAGAGMQVFTVDGATGGSRGAYSIAISRP